MAEVGTARNLRGLGDLASDERRYANAVTRYEESLAIYDDVGDFGAVGWARLDIATALAALGEVAAACESLADATDAWRRIESENRVAVASAVSMRLGCASFDAVEATPGADGGPR